MLNLTTAIAIAFVAESPAESFVEPAQEFIVQAVQRQNSIPQSRQEQLAKIATYIAQQTRGSQPVNLTFVCTHNSRRSQFSQVWSAVAAEYYKVPNVSCFSGGTEATACNIRTVRALRRSGLSVAVENDGKNPRYLVQFSDDQPAIRLYSKVYSDEPNPQENFAAVMCCSDADRNCPNVEGATLRVPLHYLDPKVADGTSSEADRYDERCLEIARDMFFIMHEAKRLSEN